MSRRTTTAAALVALVAALASACTGGSDPPSTSRPTPSPVPVKVAFFQDLTPPGASQVVTPSFLALRLALSDAEARGDIPAVPEVVALDTEGDPARALELAHDVADDDAYIAAVMAPFWDEPVEVGSILDAAGVPTLSLSGLDPALGRQGWGSWRRLVAGTKRQVSSFASALRASPGGARGICVLEDGSAYATTVAELLVEELGGTAHVATTMTLTDDGSAEDLVASLRPAGCDTIAWTGFTPGGVAVRTAMSEAALGGIAFLGMDATKSDGFLTASAGSAEGTIVVCACVDITASTAPETGRFIHDFQAEFGSPPGAYAAEGWDAGGMLVGAFASGAVDRVATAAAIGGLDAYRGLATTYGFAADGELDLTSTAIHVFRAEGIRWVPVGETAPRTDLPVSTPGYLSVAACRSGRPFVYRSSGRSRGFDVELAGTLARRLGLALSWSDRSCPAALRAVDAGTLDAMIVPVAEVGQGMPVTRVALGLHAALVSTRVTAKGARPLLDRLGPHDLVAVSDDPEVRAWARTAIPATGATMKLVRDPETALQGLGSGAFTAVAEPERDAWAAVERRPSLAVAQSVDIGARDVIVAKGPDAILVAAIDQVLGRLMGSGRYTLLFAKYFPGVPLPPETGS